MNDIQSDFEESRETSFKKCIIYVGLSIRAENILAQFSIHVSNE